MPEKAKPGQEVAAGGSLVDRIWRFFCSIRLALVLMLVLTVLSLFGGICLRHPLPVPEP
jgi:hypothetical protein